jgi:hypothetical protein
VFWTKGSGCLRSSEIWGIDESFGVLRILLIIIPCLVADKRVGIEEKPRAQKNLIVG